MLLKAKMQLIKYVKIKPDGPLGFFIMFLSVCEDVSFTDCVLSHFKLCGRRFHTRFIAHLETDQNVEVCMNTDEHRHTRGCKFLLNWIKAIMLG